ncbi:serine/threonine-protein kinase [Pyxidicoccus sp. 3LG]
MACKHCAVTHPVGTVCPAVHPASPAPEGALEGQRHGPLVLRRRLGAGALGTVYLAEHLPSAHRFAVKVLHPQLAARPDMRARFYKEARALRELTHRHVARVLDARPGPGGLPCLLMEYANGEPFSRLPMPLAPVEAVELLGQALSAVEAAHARGLVHGDLSADNLVLTRDARGERRVKVLDFGASAILTASLSEEERACGMVVGSPAFISPEQWSGEAVDGRADLYALGVVGYLLVTGRLPFGFGRVGELTPPEPHVLNPSVPPGLSVVLLRALAQRPGDRFPDARSFRQRSWTVWRPSRGPGWRPRRSSMSTSRCRTSRSSWTRSWSTPPRRPRTRRSRRRVCRGTSSRSPSPWCRAMASASSRALAAVPSPASSAMPCRRTGPRPCTSRCARPSRVGTARSAWWRSPRRVLPRPRAWKSAWAWAPPVGWCP